MRDIIVTAIILGALPYALMRPQIGILLWTWVSYMNPHRLCYGFAYSLPFAQIIAVVTLISFFSSKEPKRLPKHPIIKIWIFLIIWMCITTVFAVYPDEAGIELVRVLKIQLFAILTLIIINNRERLERLIWVTIISIGFFGVKGGVFTILTAGSGRVYGPPGSYIEENNALAIATLMIAPLIVYKMKQITNKHYKRIFILCIVLITASVIGSFSRGALLAVLSVAFFGWLKSERKGFGLLALAIIPLIITLMPDSYLNRMETMETYQQDASAMGRIYAWGYAINIASDRLTGGGFNHWSLGTYQIWGVDGGKRQGLVAHSIYFHMLGDHGWPGLIMYLLIFYLTWRYVKQIIKAAKQAGKEYQWMVSLGQSLQISYIAFATGSTFLSLQYFDLGWNLIGMTIILGEIAKKAGILDTTITN